MDDISAKDEAAIFQKLQPVEYQRRFIAQEIRPDGRTFAMPRTVKIQQNSINCTQGSATVKVGDTIVICGIKAEIAEPLATEPRKGFFVPNIDLSPLCSHKFRQGPPSEQTQANSHLIDELFKNVSILNLEELCIVPNMAVWVLYADIICLNYDGAILDACLVALMSALKNLRLPKIEIDEGIAIPQGLQNIPLTLNRVVFSSTFCLFDDNILFDPTDNEEEVSNTLITIMVDNNGDFCGQLIAGGDGISKSQLDQCTEMSLKRTLEIVGLLSEK